MPFAFVAACAEMETDDVARPAEAVRDEAGRHVHVEGDVGVPDRCRREVPDAERDPELADEHGGDRPEQRRPSTRTAASEGARKLWRLRHPITASATSASAPSTGSPCVDPPAAEAEPVPREHLQAGEADHRTPEQRPKRAGAPSGRATRSARRSRRAPRRSRAATPTHDNAAVTMVEPYNRCRD